MRFYGRHLNITIGKKRSYKDIQPYIYIHTSYKYIYICVKIDVYLYIFFQAE